MARYVVDGMNVIGARPDGWWRDRDAAARRLLARLQRAAERSDDEISVVLDGRPLADVPEGVHRGVTVHYARRAGRDAADDRIVELVAT
jgi:predicted RNA-binding protein with PIN domain